MPLPLNGLSIEELEHYSGIEPGASEELARRIAAGRSAEEREIERMREEVYDADARLSDKEDELNEAEDSLAQITNAARAAREVLEALLPSIPTPSEHREKAVDIIKLLEALT